MSALALATSMAWAQQEEQQQQEDTQVAAAEPASFSKLDADGDGRVSAIEAANDTKIAAAFTDADTDKDGYLSQEEFSQISMQQQGMESETSPESQTTTPPSDTSSSPPRY